MELGRVVGGMTQGSVLYREAALFSDVKCVRNYHELEHMQCITYISLIRSSTARTQVGEMSVRRQRVPFPSESQRNYVRVTSSAVSH